MSRLERRILRLNDEIVGLLREEQLVAGEFEMLRHLDDDAQRDAAVGGPLEREDARTTSADVKRFERHLEELRRTRRDLEAKRDRLVARLG